MFTVELVNGVYKKVWHTPTCLDCCDSGTVRHSTGGGLGDYVEVPCRCRQANPVPTMVDRSRPCNIITFRAPLSTADNSPSAA